jgi:uncharacterized DUF497 family protein/uncharacterized protein (DUF4415 family)
MRYGFDTAKQASSLKKHGLDLADARKVIESGQTVTFEDRRFAYSEERIVPRGRSATYSWQSSLRKLKTTFTLSRCARQTDMSKASTVKTSSDALEDAPVRRADITAGKLVLRKRGAGDAVLPNKQRVNIFLDGAVIEHFKSKAGERGYQTLINEALKHAIQAETIERVVRKTIREELRRT